MDVIGTQQEHSFTLQLVKLGIQLCLGVKCRASDQITSRFDHRNYAQGWF